MAQYTVEEAGAFYGSMMREVKVRLASIPSQLNLAAKYAHMPEGMIHFESSVLQVRFVCELVALAAIIAHQEDPRAEAIMDEYSADVIFKRLSETNEKCYPQAVTEDERLHFNFNKGAQLTRQQIQQIYGRCGNYLHRGKVKRGPEGLRTRYDLRMVRDWAQALEHLLEIHIITLPHLNKILLVHMNGPKGEVSVRSGEGEEGGSFVQVDGA